MQNHNPLIKHGLNDLVRQSQGFCHRKCHLVPGPWWRKPRDDRDFCPWLLSSTRTSLTLWGENGTRYHLFDLKRNCVAIVRTFRCFSPWSSTSRCLGPDVATPCLQWSFRRLQTRTGTFIWTSNQDLGLVNCLSYAFGWTDEVLKQFCCSQYLADWVD